MSLVPSLSRTSNESVRGLLIACIEVGYPMPHRLLSVTREDNGWHVRLNGMDIVSFCGPHARDRAFREREHLADLLDAQPSGDDLSGRPDGSLVFENAR